MTIAWVIGSGGLLGAALCRTLRAQGTQVFSPPQAFCWRDPIQLHSQFREAVPLFAQTAHEAGAWEIYWAAGVGTMGSAPEQLRPETEALANLLQLVEAEPGLNRTTGAITLASSAGAIYAGHTAIVIDETCDPAPTTAYAHEKLKQEELLRAFAQTHSKCSVLLARISTLYGPGGAVGKQQGLITHIARCLLRNQPIQIYVPLDTIRDYISAEDAASMMVATLRGNASQGSIQTRILASEQPTTIAEVISIFKRITRRNPRIVTSASKLSAVYSRRIQFLTEKTALQRSEQTPTTLVVGIAAVMAAERALYTNTKNYY